MKKVDLNVDIGEGFPYDRELLQFATSANVCCGEHAGNWELTQATVELCHLKGTRLGMHPGFPDRESMGRHVPKQLPSEWADSLTMQFARFVEQFTAAYIKPHGAWYQILSDANVVPTSMRDAQLTGYCSGILFGMVAEASLAAMLLPSSSAFKAMKTGGTSVIAEGFADRAYRPDGTLVPRSEPGAVLEDPDQIKAQVLRLAKEVDSICLHGDTPNCLEFAEMVTKTLLDHGYEVGY